MRFVALCLLLCGCSAMKPSPGEELNRSLLAFHEHLRWKRFDKASLFVPFKEREKFLALYEPAEDTLEIDEIEVQNIEWATDKKAKVTVNVRFYKLPSVTLEKKKWVEEWRRDSGLWTLVSDINQPFFPQPATQSASAPSG